MRQRDLLLSATLTVCAVVAAGAFAQTAQPAPAATSTATTTTTTTTSTTTTTTTVDRGHLGLQPNAMEGETPSYVKPETPEERTKRVGPVDPGPNPDEHTIFFRNGIAYHIAKFERKWAAFDQPPGFVRPFAYTPFIYELYQANKDWVWVWVKEPGQDQPTAPGAEAVAGATAPQKMFGRYTADQIRYLNMMKPEYSALDVPNANVTVRFEEASDGLPKTGSWRNTLAVADMNGDGMPDIVAPPQRGGSNGLPSIFLGDGKGHWRPWNETVWPFGLDYGSVVAADFNKDGHMDLAFGVHLNGIHVFLGDGKGHFTDSSEGLPGSDWGTRRVVIGDFDGDGYPDVAAISEGPRPNAVATSSGNIRVFLNRDRGKKWVSVDAATNRQPVAGDYLATGNLNGDRTPDLVSGNIFFGSTQAIFLSGRPEKKLPTWTPLGAWTPEKANDTFVPAGSYYFAVATGHLTSKKKDDALLSFARVFPEDATPFVGKPEIASVIGIDRYSFAGPKITRTPVVRFEGSRPITGLAVADFDGDGNADILFTTFIPRRECVLLLGDGKGGFRRAAVEGLNLEELANYDITVADVNHDGRPDVVIGYESGADSKLGAQTGSIQVFLNRGAKVASAAASRRGSAAQAASGE